MVCSSQVVCSGMWHTSFARARVTATLTRRQSASSRPASRLELDRTSDTSMHSLSRPCTAFQLDGAARYWIELAWGVVAGRTFTLNAMLHCT